MNTICLSTDKRFVEAWNNGTRVLLAPVEVFGLHEAFGQCLNYLREWTGQEPTIDAHLKAKLNEIEF